MKNNIRRFAAARLGFALSLAAVFASGAFAQPPPQANRPGNGPRPPATIAPDPRVQQRSYDFKDTGEKLSYVLYVSSKVSKDKKNPLIVALHGYGGDGNFLVRDRLVDLAEEGGYIVVGPLGYNVTGWYGSPVIVIGGGPVEPPNLTELSEKDVLNVLAMMREEFRVDDDRTYLLGHSMGGAGTLFLGQKYASRWAAIAAIAPAAFRMEPNRADILGPIKKAGLPVIVVQGDQDNVVPPDNTRHWVESLKDMGLDYRYVEIPGGDHGTVIKDGMGEIFNFFAGHTRAH